jgi:hypothetical protein
MEFGKNPYIKWSRFRTVNSRQVKQGVLAGLAVVLLMGSSTAFAYSGSAVHSSNLHSSNPQPLSFAVGSPTNPVGAVVSLGNQTYNVKGGNVVLPLTFILGQSLSQATIHFSLNAAVRNLNTSGNVQFLLTGILRGLPVAVFGSYAINNTETSTPANAIQYVGPSGVCSGVAESPCSELPLSFIGNVNVRVAIGNGAPQILRETISMENPYLNPFGAPIVIASLDSRIVIVTTYNVGTINWSGAQIEGAITNGTLGTGSSATPVTGMLALNSTENENLVTGAAADRGAVALTSMSPSSLDVSGTFSGNSMIPTVGEVDCSPSFGFPSFPAGQGVCTQTGFNSVGQFNMSTPNSGYGGGSGEVTVVGQYATTWTVPALAFSTTSTANVTTPANTDR